MTKLILAEQKQLDLQLSTNVFSVGYAGLEKGLTLSTDKGPDPLRPRNPFVAVGYGFVSRDAFVDKDLGPLGCIYHTIGEMKAVVYRAVVQTITPEGRKAFSLLRKPLEAKPEQSLLKVSTAMPSGVKIKAAIGHDGREHPIRVWSGVRTNGQVILAADGEYLVELKSGEYVTIFFPDGYVRHYKQDADVLLEVKLSPITMAKLRIEDAQLRLKEASPQNWPDEERRESQLRFILFGMADLFHLTAKDVDGEVRKELAQFFINISADELSLVHRKLMAILHQTDPVMVYAFATPSSDSTVTPMKNPMPELLQNKASAEARRRERADRERERRETLKGSSSGGSNQQKQRKK